MSGTRTFLLELHCEEIPARFLKPLTSELACLVSMKLREHGLWDAPNGTPVIDSKGVSEELLSVLKNQGWLLAFSPRKIAWRIPELRVHQEDQTETQVGPPQRMCVGEDGKPTMQGLKFAEKWGLSFDAVRFEQPAGKKEPCAVVTVTKKGRPTKELLAEALPGLIAGLHVPKAMRWGLSEFEFVRPIRNILCLFGEEVVDFTVDGVKAGNRTWGHRLHHMQHPNAIQVNRPEDYEAALAKAGVVVSFADRKAALDKQLQELAKEVGGKLVSDEHLLDTLAEIVEFPKIVRGEFPQEFLELPKEVLVTSLKEHQKAFCVEDAKGDLLPHFLTAANRPDDPAGFVKSGNEWVLKARLYDARFFFAEDRKHRLDTRLESLKHLTFQKELGSYFDKTERVAAMSKYWANTLGLKFEDAELAARAAKCDLRTLMVGEFPELQGSMGGEYLRLEGAPESVWRAVKEHYKPVSADDSIPQSPLGCLLSLVDKFDTVATCFAIGLIPSGSKDPLALRRAGQGLVRIIWEKPLAIDIKELIVQGVNHLGSVLDVGLDRKKLMHDLAVFLKDRIGFQLEQAGYPAAVRRSILATVWSDPDRAWAESLFLESLKDRCKALSAFAEDSRFASLAQSVKRIANILKDELPAETFEPSTLQQPEEKVLAERLKQLEATKDHGALLEALAELAQPLEAFFTAVMVKCEDEKLRAARLSLLHRLRQAFLRVADFSQWQ